MTQPQRIGFIGLGMMGTPMTACLAKAGFELFLADADAGRLHEVQTTLNASALTVENARSLDILITMLPNSNIVENVLLGEGGWAASLAPQAVVIDMSSSEPARSRELGQQLKTLNLDYLDAPVSGGVKRAVDGSLAILVGGDAEVMQRCRPVLDAMGKNILHIGEAGSGHAAKALNNFVSAAGLMATVEALHVAKRFGIDPGVMVDVLNASSGGSNTSLNKARQFMLSGTFGSGFSMQLMNKDLKIAKGLSDALDYPMIFGQSAIKVWNDVAQDATPTTDHTEMYRMLAKEGE
ncbi:NAD(P)-dependent oxidoreductase [Pseudomonas sp. efr-133-TYG-103a]|uniref:NAD(P)-dependent oxidoreductase n=1 Tax=Pseudomonas sp. efr-133-TYG-103a TaxID=3040308 RepID=UPI00255650FB|nr:NAD(P)-dependent oxidoreductase [Pseudomonas sp. efr-133-TYG-103a]